RKAFGKLLLGCSQFFHLSPIDRFDQCISRRKVAIQSSRSNTCLFGDVVEAGVRAEPSKRLLRHLQNALAVPLRVGARFSRGRVRILGRHKKKVATGDSLRLSYLLIRRHSPFYPERGGSVNSVSRWFRLREVRNMNPLARYKLSRNSNPSCGDLM